MINLRNALVRVSFACLFVSLIGCGGGDRQDALAVLNEGDSEIASISAEIGGLCDRLRDLLTKSDQAMSSESATEFRTLLSSLGKLQKKRESLRMIGTNADLVSLAAKSRRLQNEIKQTSDPSTRTSLVAEKKSADDSLENAIEQAGITDASHKTATEADSAAAQAFSKAMGIHFFLANAVEDSTQAMNRRVKGAADALITFTGMQKKFRECLTALGGAAAKIDVADRDAAVIEAIHGIDEIAAKEEDAKEETRRLRLSS